MWFERNQFGSSVPGKISTLYYYLRESRENPDNHSRFRQPGVKTLMGFLIPEFQRELVWTDQQKIAFVDSARRCVPLGTYTINLTFGHDDALRNENGVEYYYGDGWLLDGQQRLNALEEFFDDKLRVHGMVWSEIAKDDQRQFLNTPNFAYYETKFVLEEQARAYYDLMNFGGTPHQEHERAFHL